MKAARAEEAGAGDSGSGGGGGGGGEPGTSGSQAEELVPAEVNAELLKQMEEMVGGPVGCSVHAVLWLRGMAAHGSVVQCHLAAHLSASGRQGCANWPHRAIGHLAHTA